MQQNKNKENALFAYADKIWPSQKTALSEPFPSRIHQLLTIYIQFCYYMCIFPTGLKYNRITSQYETSSNIIQRIFFTILWTFNMIQFLGVITRHIITTTPGHPIQVLLLLGGLGHFADFSVYFATVIYYKEEITALINYLVLHGSLSSETPTSFSSNLSQYESDSYNTSNRFKNSWQNILTFERISVVWCFMTLVAGIKCTDIVNTVLEGSPLLDMDNSDFYKLLNETLVPGIEDILNSSSISSHILHTLLNIIHLCSYMQKFCGVFIYGLEVMIVFCMKCISSHFTASLLTPRHYWKPSSINVLSGFIIVRRIYRMINKIFGWLFFYSIMGEFPNFTFYLIFKYRSPNAPMQWPYLYGLFCVFIILILASLAINELSKIKDWMQYEDKRHWSLTNGYSLERKIILFELSLNRNALYAHGYFQLSLPALVSIAGGILSNALIILQLALSNDNGKTVNTNQ